MGYTCKFNNLEKELFYLPPTNTSYITRHAIALFPYDLF